MLFRSDICLFIVMCFFNDICFFTCLGHFVFALKLLILGIVRIRVEDIEVSNGLKIISKSTTIEPTRNYVHSPVVIVSENFDCINEVLTIEFEEKVNVKYLLIKNTDKYKSYNKIKTINIKAY